MKKQKKRKSIHIKRLEVMGACVPGVNYASRLLAKYKTPKAAWEAACRTHSPNKRAQILKYMRWFLYRLDLYSESTLGVELEYIPDLRTWNVFIERFPWRRIARFWRQVPHSLSAIKANERMSQ